MNEQPCFAVVRNIPKSFHSSDLRNFFSQLIEEKVFLCFHYKHRPEVIKCAKGWYGCIIRLKMITLNLINLVTGLTACEFDLMPTFKFEKLNL